MTLDNTRWRHTDGRRGVVR